MYKLVKHPDYAEPRQRVKSPGCDSYRSHLPHDAKEKRPRPNGVSGGEIMARGPVLSFFHHTSHLFSGARTMGASALQLNAFWNSGRLESGPMTRYFPIGCSSDCIMTRCSSMRMASPRHWPHAMKNCYSGVKPSMSGGRVLPSRDFWKARNATLAPPRSPMLSPNTSLPLW
jgi:hypothetical protein